MSPPRDRRTRPPEGVRSSFSTGGGLRVRVGVGVPSTCARGPAPRTAYDEKVANREIRIWHLVIENGY
jgi:hypothetical protein